MAEETLHTSISPIDILQVADTVAQEKGISKEDVIEAMEAAIQKAGRSKYGHEFDVRAEINRDNGDIVLKRFMEIVKDVEDKTREISLKDAKKKNPDAKIGDFQSTVLPPIDLVRIAAQTAKQVIVQKVREVERKKQYEEYKDRVGEIVNGVVKRIEFGNLVIDLGRAEAILRREELLANESFRRSDRIRAYIYDVQSDTRGPQIFLSRAHPQFMAQLFKQEVPEIYDGVIEIKSVARDPGSRAKIAVSSNDSSIDPVGACVGMRGSRVQAVVSELQGEKIDIVPWSEDTATFVVNSLAPAEVSKIIIDEDTKRIEVVIPDDQLSLAIGRRGQNVRLASVLSGWEIDILTEEQESDKRSQEFKEKSKILIDALGIDDVIAHLLVTEGYSSPDELTSVSPEEVTKIEGFDSTIANEVIQKAKDFVSKRNKKIDQEIEKLGISRELLDLPHIEPTDLFILSKSGIQTLDNLADLSSDELIEILDASKLKAKQADEIIMAAREHWFKDDEEKETEIETNTKDATSEEAKKKTDMKATKESS